MRIAVHGCNARKKSRRSHFDSERAHPGRSAQRNPNAAGYSAPFSLSGAAAAWKAALHARQNEAASILVAHFAHEPQNAQVVENQEKHFEVHGQNCCTRSDPISFNTDFGIDRLIVQPFVTVKTSHPGRMSPVTATAFLLSGIGLLMMRPNVATRAQSLVLAMAASAILSIGTTAMLNYSMGMTVIYGWGAQLTQVALHTAMGFILVGSGLLLSAWKFSTTETYRKPMKSW
jgi:hypothetical protein